MEETFQVVFMDGFYRFAYPGLPDNRMVDIGSFVAFFYTQAAGCISLGVKIDYQGLLFGGCKRCREVDCGCGFSNKAYV